MKLNQLTRSSDNKKKRMGRGHGSGKVKTGGRGQKGQKARETIKMFFEGGQLPLIKRLPFKRGKGRNYSLKNENFVINLSKLNSLEPNTIVDSDLLIKKGFITKEIKNQAIKILANGELKVALIVKLPCSKSAQKKITEAGGKCEQNT